MADMGKGRGSPGCSGAWEAGHEGRDLGREAAMAAPVLIELREVRKRFGGHDGVPEV